MSWLVFMLAHITFCHNPGKLMSAVFERLTRASNKQSVLQALAAVHAAVAPLLSRPEQTSALNRVPGLVVTVPSITLLGGL